VEAGIARTLRNHLLKPAALADSIDDLSASEIPDLQVRLQHIANDCDPDGAAASWAPLLRRADLAQGCITLRLDRKILAKRLDIKSDRIDAQARRIISKFQMQRRGVEAKIIMGAATPQADPVLVKNILMARRWCESIKAGASFGAIAKQEKTTPSRIQQMIGLAFLAPDILDQIAAGRQPVTFTSEWFKRRQLPEDWDLQRKLIGEL
jgi:site-specific DNA recombinase